MHQKFGTFGKKQYLCNVKKKEQQQIKNKDYGNSHLRKNSTRDLKGNGYVMRFVYSKEFND